MDGGTCAGAGYYGTAMGDAQVVGGNCASAGSGAGLGSGVGAVAGVIGKVWDGGYGAETGSGGRLDKLVRQK